mgnify:CR=1 FL=1
MNLLYEQHKGIVQAVFDKNVKVAKDIMTEHINKVMGDVAVLKTRISRILRIKKVSVYFIRRLFLCCKAFALDEFGVELGPDGNGIGPLSG